MKESKRISNFPMRKIERSEFKKYKFLKRFLEMPDPPKQIFVRGQFPNEDLKFLAIVGSRKITTYGTLAIEKIVHGLKCSPICIISGLAIGVDGIAHKESLKVGLSCIAVPGSSLGEKEIYPSLNRNLALNILQSGGLLLSEFELGHPTYPTNFPARNRLMAALCDAVLLIEASEKSGTLITARLALDYNKDVLCVPGSIFSENSIGTNDLIKDGARTITSAEDILHHFRINFEEQKKDTAQNLNTTEKIIMDLLTEPTKKDSLLEKSKLETVLFITTLSGLLIKDLIAERNGTIFKS